MLVRIKFVSKSRYRATNTVCAGSDGDLNLALLGRPRVWRHSVLSLSLHCLAVFLAVRIVHMVEAERVGWFDHVVSVQYVNLKDHPGVLFLDPPGARPTTNRVRAPRQTSRHLRAAVSDSAGSPPRRANIPNVPGTGHLAAGVPAIAVPISSDGQRAIPASPSPEIPPASASAEPSDELRMIHPENGRFDVVLVGAIPEGAPESFRSGPVYTVYLDVGKQKRWLLHYSAIRPSVQITDYVVRIGFVQPIDAPYPHITVVPPELPAAEGEPITIAGVIDTNGVFRQVRPIRSTPDDYGSRLMQLLKKWLFRPASKAGEPTEVAVMLVVPRS